MRRIPRWYQKQAIEVVKKLDYQAGIFADLGVGKTLIAIHCSKTPAIVFCRRDDFQTWTDQLTNEGVPLQDIQQISKGTQQPKLTPWMLVSYGSLGLKGQKKKKRRIKPSVLGEWIIRQPFQTAIAEESHCIKEPRAARSKLVVMVSRHIPRRFALTATPTPQGPEDIFQQMLFVDNGKTFGDDWWAFKNKYFFMVGPQMFIRKGSREIIDRKMRSRSFFIDQQVALTIPPIRRKIIQCAMSKPQQSLYDQIKKEWEYTVTYGELSSTEEIQYVIQQVSKLHQVAGGFIYLPDETAQYLPCPKLHALQSIIRKLNEPKVVIWCAFTAEIERVVRFLGTSAVAFYGSDQEKKLEARRKFANDPATRFFVGQISSGVGINDLVIANTAIYYSLDYKLISLVQSEGRIRRFGCERHSHLNFIFLLTEKSIDQKIYGALRQKHDFLTSVLASINLLDTKYTNSL